MRRSVLTIIGESVASRARLLRLQRLAAGMVQATVTGLSTVAVVSRRKPRALR
jgi:O-succinylbenzoate synthase